MIPSPIDSGIQKPQIFTIYCELEGISALILESRELGTLSETAHDREMALLRFHDDYIDSALAMDTDTFCLGILWHLAYISLLTDLNQLEICTGRDGHGPSQRHMEYATTWAQSQDARRCAVHGALILRKAEKMWIGPEPAVHVPRALFCAALIWYSYVEFGQDNSDSGPIGRIDAPELKKLGICGQKLLFEAQGFKHTRPTRLDCMTLCDLHDLLKRIGHSGISQKFASLIIYMVYGETDEGVYRTNSQ